MQTDRDRYDRHEQDESQAFESESGNTPEMHGQRFEALSDPGSLRREEGSGETERTDDLLDHQQLVVSVVLTTNDRDRFEEFVQAAESVLAQTYSSTEVVLVVDADRRLYERIDRMFGHLDDVATHFKPSDDGLSESRNYGAKMASGDVVAFTDDDVIADPQWVSGLVEAYQSMDVVATGGPADPIWPQRKRPWWLPSEFDWLVGVTHDGSFRTDGIEEVRNTFGCNISFDRETFLKLGGFRPSLGKQSNKSIQGEEAELCARLSSRFDTGLAYNPRARIHHRVFAKQIEPTALCERAFWQGYSKYQMQRLVTKLDAEGEFLRNLLLRALPSRIVRTVKDPSVKYPVQMAMLTVLTLFVGIGYLYGFASSVTSGHPDLNS